MIEDRRELVHGTDQCYYNTIFPNGFSQRKRLLGMRSFSSEVEQTIDNYFADNVVHLSLKGTKTVSGELVFYNDVRLAQNMDFAINHLGYRKNSNGSITDTGNSKNCAVSFLETVTTELGDVRQLITYYNLTLSSPTYESVTDEDSASPAEFTIPFTANPSSFALDDNGKECTFSVIRETAETKPFFEALEQGKISIFLPNLETPIIPTIVVDSQVDVFVGENLGDEALIEAYLIANANMTFENFTGTPTFSCIPSSVNTENIGVVELEVKYEDVANNEVADELVYLNIVPATPIVTVDSSVNATIGTDLGDEALIEAYLIANGNLSYENFTSTPTFTSVPTNVDTTVADTIEVTVTYTDTLNNEEASATTSIIVS